MADRFATLARRRASIAHPETDRLPRRLAMRKRCPKCGNDDELVENSPRVLLHALPQLSSPIEVEVPFTCAACGRAACVGRGPRAVMGRAPGADVRRARRRRRPRRRRGRSRRARPHTLDAGRRRPGRAGPHRADPSRPGNPSRTRPPQDRPHHGRSERVGHPHQDRRAHPVLATAPRRHAHPGDGARGH